MIKIDQLVVTQNAIRNDHLIDGMIAFVRSGGIWDDLSLCVWATLNNHRNSRRIYISRFPDGMLAIHDGHHRLVATHLGGRDHIQECEYELHDWDYSDYTNVKWEFNYVTPYDPRTEVRLADFGVFKDQVLVIARKDRDTALEMIASRRNEYCCPRPFRSVADLAKTRIVSRATRCPSGAQPGEFGYYTEAGLDAMCRHASSHLGRPVDPQKVREYMKLFVELRNESRSDAALKGA